MSYSATSLKFLKLYVAVLNIFTKKIINPYKRKQYRLDVPTYYLCSFITFLS